MPNTWPRLSPHLDLLLAWFVGTKMSNHLARDDSSPGHCELLLLAHRFFESQRVELHKKCLKYLSQPDLLRVSSLSKHWRALAIKESRFYLATHLQDGSETGVEAFIQRLGGAVDRKMPIGIILNVEGPAIGECATSDAECDLLAEKVSPAIERSMPYVRKLSVVSGSPLPLITLEFLRAPAPDLREFVFRTDFDVDTDESDETSSGGSKYYARAREARAGERAYRMHMFNLENILRCLFGRAAPRLTRVHLGGIVLAALRRVPVSAFHAATHVELIDLTSFPEFGLGHHFPKAKYMQLELENRCLQDSNAACARSAFLPAGLATLNVWTAAAVLRELLERADVAAVPDLHIAFDAHYDDHARFAAWEGCLAARGTHRRLKIFSTSWDKDGRPEDLRISVSDDLDARTAVTFYAEDSFRRPPYPHEPYSPLFSLCDVIDNVTVISVEHAHLNAIFSITTAAFPALRSLHVALRAGKPLRSAFWKLGSHERRPLALPALTKLEISCGSDMAISSNELASFARAIGLSATHRPRLILRGVTIEGEPLHAGYSAMQMLRLVSNGM